MAPRKVNIAHSDSTSYRNTRHNSISSVTTTPSIVLDPFSPSHSPLMSGRSASMHTPSKQGSLSVPQSSSAPTSFGTHFPDRRGSAESHHGRAMTIGSAISSSSSHLSGPAREAVTDPREIVQVNPAGMVVFGTLEGFVKRLIMHFSKPTLNTFAASHQMNIGRFKERGRIPRCTPCSLHRFHDSRGFVCNSGTALLRRGNR